MSGIERETAVPLYLQIADDIRNKIKSGELKENSRIPTEAELSQSYQVSRITIRKALEILEDEEILVRRQRLGTFVSARKMSRSLNCFMGFTKSCELSGKKSGDKAPFGGAGPRYAIRCKTPAATGGGSGDLHSAAALLRW